MTGLIILAAGSSTRLGKPKQNLIFKGVTLLQRAVRVAKQSVNEPVIVVLGANYDVIYPTIKDEGATIIFNANWAAGMATSIVEGIKHLQKLDNVDAALIMLCDQPYVNTDLLNQLINKRETGSKGIVASLYNHIKGVPALFDENYFGALLKLRGDEGAKKIVHENLPDVDEITFALGSIDIDTEMDFYNFCKFNDV